MRVEQEKPQPKPGTTATLATTAGSAIESGFRAVFKTEPDRVILKWTF